MTNDLDVLINQAQSGDMQAFGQVYSLFLKKIYRFIYFMVGNQQLAQDLTQNTFIKVWRALPSFSKSKGTFQAYLYAIARNLVTDYRRKKKDLSLDLDFVKNIKTEENIEENLLKDEEKREFYNSLSHLDDLEKQMIILRYFEEWSFADIAKTFDMQPGAVRVRIHRIINKLKTILGV